MFSANGEYIIVGALFMVYFALKLKLFPGISHRLNPRDILIVFFCAIALLNLHVYNENIKRNHRMDLVSASEKSLRDLAELLPETQRVGFITDIKKPYYAHRLERLFLTRYALAPRIVEEGTAPDWVVVNATEYCPELIPADLVLVRDFGEGLMLFRRRNQ
jgi:hypothetical protein